MRDAADMPLEIVKRSDSARGFKILPKRWIFERTFGWLGRCRRLAKGLGKPQSITRGLLRARHDPNCAAADRKRPQCLNSLADRFKVNSNRFLTC